MFAPFGTSAASRAASFRRRGLLASAVVGALVLAGCASGSSPTSSSSSDGSVPASGEVVFFGLPQDNPYVGQMVMGATEQAKKYGWTLKFVESSAQPEQDNAIQQLLAGGQKPVGVILHPALASSAVASENALMKANLPLIITNQVPSEESAPLFDAYAGTSDTLNGKLTAELLSKKAAELKQDLGDGLIIGYPAGYQGHTDRVNAFTKALAESDPNSTILETKNSTGFGAQDGYTVASQIVPANKGKFKWIYALNDALAVGVIKALNENGLTPGKDVLVVGGTCLGSPTVDALESGQLVGTAVQSGRIEGQLAVITLHQFLASGGKVTSGSIDVGSDQPPSDTEAPHKYNYMPNTLVDNTTEAFNTTKTWGYTAAELCGY